MKNVIMIIIDLIRMPVFFIYCVFVWLSRIDSCKAFRCIAMQFILETLMLFAYVLTSSSVSIEIGLTMLSVMIFTLIAGYFIIGKPRTVSDWNYIFRPVKYVFIPKSKNSENIDVKEHSSVELKDMVDDKVGKVSYRNTEDTDILSSDSDSKEIEVENEVANRETDVEDENNDVMSDTEISDMLMKSFDEYLVDVGTKSLLEECTEQLDNDDEVIDIPDDNDDDNEECLNEDSIEVSDDFYNGGGLVVNSDEDNLGFQVNDNINETSLISDVDDDEEI